MRILIFFLCLLFFSGCSNKAPLTKEIFLPIRCKVDIPKKPKLDGSFESHKAKMLYLLECERLLHYCVGANDE